MDNFHNNEESNEPMNEELSMSKDDDFTSTLIQQSIVYNPHRNEMEKYILEVLSEFYEFNNNKIAFLSNRRYNEINYPYYNDYFIVNSNWMKNFLFFYNYKALLPLIKKQKKKKFII